MKEIKFPNREEFLNVYTVNKEGVITTKGRFEGEFIYTPYFYRLIIDGESVQIIRDVEGAPREFLDTFYIERRDLEAFPELATQGYKEGDTISFTEDDRGFYFECRKVVRIVDGEIVTEEEI